MQDGLGTLPTTSSSSFCHRSASTFTLLRKDPVTKSDDFLEKFQNAFEPPLIFGRLCCNFFVMDMVEYMQVGTRAI